MPALLQPGDKISVPKGLIRHVGVYVGHLSGRQGVYVLHNSKQYGRVVLDQLADFSRGSPVCIVQKAPAHARSLVVERALSMQGRRYNLWTFNCEHVANLALHQKRTSEQLMAAGTVVAGLAIAWKLATRPDYDAVVDRFRYGNGRFAPG